MSTEQAMAPFRSRLSEAILAVEAAGYTYKTNLKTKEFFEVWKDGKLVVAAAASREALEFLGLEVKA